MGAVKRGQVAIEYILIFAFIFLIMVGVLGVIGQKMIVVQEDNNKKTRERIKNYMRSYIGMASSADDGFNAIFRLPSKVGASNYSINISDNKVLVVKFANGETYAPLSGQVMGKFCHEKWDEPKYQVRVRKINGTVEVSSCDNCTIPYEICHEAEESGTCSSSLTAPEREQCRNGYCKCLP